MNYRKVKLIVIVKDLTVYNVTAVTKDNNNIELFPYYRHTINSMCFKTFTQSTAMYEWLHRLASSNMMHVTLISNDFDSKLYDINFINISDMTVTRHYYNA